MTLRGHTTTAAGTLAWTAMPLSVAPLARALSDRIGGRPIIALGLTLDGADRTKTRKETP